MNDYIPEENNPLSPGPRDYLIPGEKRLVVKTELANILAAEFREQFKRQIIGLDGQTTSIKLHSCSSTELIVHTDSGTIEPVADNKCWRCLSDDEMSITKQWLEWAGFQERRNGWFLGNFSFGSQIEQKFNKFWMETTHNRIAVTRRWEVRSLLAVHRDRLVELGYDNIFKVYND